MSSDYEEFIKYIYHEHIEKRLDKHIKHWHHMEDFGYNITRLSRTMRAVRFIRDYAYDDEHVNRIFTPEMLKGIFDDTNGGLHSNNHLVVDTEIADIIEDYFGEIVDGMTVDHFPQEDFEIMRQSGSADPRREITTIVHLVKSRKEQLLWRNNDNVRFSHRLVQVTQRIETMAESLPQKPRESDEIGFQKPAVKRSVFKGLGSIIQGTLMTITNITLATGLWSVPLPTETTSVGAVVSATSGIGMIFTGVGELRGEG
jgi:hypothetical protein